MRPEVMGDVESDRRHAREKGGVAPDSLGAPPIISYRRSSERRHSTEPRSKRDEPPGLRSRGSTGSRPAGTSTARFGRNPSPGAARLAQRNSHRLLSLAHLAPRRRAQGAPFVFTHHLSNLPAAGRPAAGLPAAGLPGGSLGHGCASVSARAAVTRSRLRRSLLTPPVPTARARLTRAEPPPGAYPSKGRAAAITPLGGSGCRRESRVGCARTASARRTVFQ